MGFFQKLNEKWKRWFFGDYDEDDEEGSRGSDDWIEFGKPNRHDRGETHIVACCVRVDGVIDAAGKQTTDESAKSAGNDDGSDDDLLDVDADVTGGIHGFANDAKLIAMLAELEVVNHESKKKSDDDDD